MKVCIGVFSEAPFSLMRAELIELSVSARSAAAAGVGWERSSFMSACVQFVSSTKGTYASAQRNRKAPKDASLTQLSSTGVAQKRRIMNKDVLVRTARAMAAPGKGILAADESTGTIAKRFAAIGVDSTQVTRRDYRQFLFRAEEAINQYISGVILFDETIRQTASDGTPLVKFIEAAGAIPGIKVDLGAKPLTNFSSETITEGLDGLLERLNDYRRLGARFAKWRAVISVDSDTVFQRISRSRRMRKRSPATRRFAKMPI